MDVAKLGLEVDSSRVDKATSSMKRMERQSGKTEGAALRLAKAAKGALAGLAVGFSVAGIVRMSDEYTSLINTLRVVAGAQGDVNAILSDLNGIAERTRAPLDATARLYQRISIAGNELGASQKDILRFTENVGLALAQQGGGAAQASGALLQLSQAMGGGVVRAEEFNSILEGAYPIALAAAKGLDAAGGSVSKLRNLVIEGKVSSEDFFRAILSQTDDLEAAFANTVPTIGQAMSRLSDSMMLFIGGLNDATGASGGLARGILDVATAMGKAADWVREHGDTVKDVLGTVVASALIYTTGLMIKLGLSALTAGGQVGVLTGALTLLKGALIKTGIGALIVGAGYLIAKFMELSTAAGGFGNAMKLVGELGLEVWDRIKLGGSALVEAYRAYTAGFVLLWQQAFSTVTGLFAEFSNDIINGMQSVFRGLGAPGQAIVAGLEIARAEINRVVQDADAAAKANVSAQQEVMRGHADTAAQMAKDALAPLETWEQINAVIEAARQGASGATGTVPVVPTAPTDPPGTGGGAANDNALQASEQFISSLQDEILQMSMTEEAYRRLQVEKSAAMAPTPEMAEQIRLLGDMREVTLAQVDADERLKAAKTTLEDYQLHLDMMQMTTAEKARAIAMQELERQGIVEGTEAWNQYGQAILDAASALATAQDNSRTNIDQTIQALDALSRGFGDLASVMKDSLGEQNAVYKALFVAQHAFALASAMVAMQQAMAQALALPPPANFVYMGMAASEGATIIASIQALASGFAEGGYTGAGGKYDVAGLVHRGEVVWSQQDVARYGGWQNVDAMRRGIMPVANDNAGPGTGGTLHVVVTVDDKGHWSAYVDQASSQAVNTAVTISDQRTKARMNAAANEAQRPVISARGAA